MNVLLSVKPQYATEIARGKKTYEFRKAIFRSEEVEKVLVYVSGSVGRIIGYFHLGEIIEGSPHGVWDQCRRFAGVSRKEYFEYFAGSAKAFALEIRDFRAFEPSLNPYE